MLLETKRESWIQPMVLALLKKADVNVILTEWSKGAAVPFRQSVGNCRLVGKQVSHLIEHLHKYFRMTFSSVHLVGFSLGAQVAGYAGRNLRKSRHIIRRITGKQFQTFEFIKAVSHNVLHRSYNAVYYDKSFYIYPGYVVGISSHHQAMNVNC